MSDHFIEEEDKLIDEYLCAKTLQPPGEVWRANEYERELLDNYDEEKAKIEKEQEEFADLPEFLFEIEMFLRQDSALPAWDSKLDFVNPFWETDLKSEDVLHRNLLSTLVLGPGKVLREELSKIRYLGPIRDLPPRNHIPALSPDESRWANGLAAWDVLYTAKDDFIEDLNNWLTDEGGLNTGYEVDRKTFKELDTDSEIWFTLMRGSFLDEDMDIKHELVILPEKTRLYLRNFETGIEVAPQDIGVGISQVLPVAVIALGKQSGIVAIEQPELHIHPAIQVALGDLFISQIEEKEVTFLLETHSEHLMLRFLRRIRETKGDSLPPGKRPLNPDQVAVYFIEQSHGAIKLKMLCVDDEGEFRDEWPRGFFEEREEELLY